jgi:glucose-6-phosphate isomerase
MRIESLWVKKYLMTFDPGIEIRLDSTSLSFEYGGHVFGPKPVFRRLDEIRASLRDPLCDGPNPVYAIAMDVGRTEHHDELQRRMLLFGVVAYSSGTLGKELVRSQGHVHVVAPHCGWSTPELIEIWRGKAIVYMQEAANNDPGRCFAVEAEVGDKIVIPPGWAHFVANADPGAVLFFGAWCDREYGFDYEDVRRRGGLAWFPLVDEKECVKWEPNPAYKSSRLIKKRPREYPELNVSRERSIYEQFARSPETIQWVSDPQRVADIWKNFTP